MPENRDTVTVAGNDSLGSRPSQGKNQSQPLGYRVHLSRAERTSTFFQKRLVERKHLGDIGDRGLLQAYRAPGKAHVPRRPSKFEISSDSNDQDRLNGARVE